MSIFRTPNGSAPRLKPLPSKKAHVVSVLDIGSTKVVCMIGRLTPRDPSEVLPGRTHYDILEAPGLVEAVTPFLDAP